MVVYLAVFYPTSETINSITKWKNGLIPLFLVVGAVCVLSWHSPTFHGHVHCHHHLLSCCLWGGANKWHLIGMCLLGVVAVGALIVLETLAMERFTAFLDSYVLLLPGTSKRW